MSRRTTTPSPLPPWVLCQSLSGYVREHLATFERLLKSGARYESLLEALVVAGFENPSYTALDSALYRARRQSAKSSRRPALQGSVVLKVAATSARQTSRVTLSPTAELKAEDLI